MHFVLSISKAQAYYVPTRVPGLLWENSSWQGNRAVGVALRKDGEKQLYSQSLGILLGANNLLGMIVVVFPGRVLHSVCMCRLNVF